VRHDDAGQQRTPGPGEQHNVPLSRQAVAILKELQILTGRGRYVFPSLLSAERPMSNNTVNAALRRRGQMIFVIYVSTFTDYPPAADLPGFCHLEFHHLEMPVRH